MIDTYFDRLINEKLTEDEIIHIFYDIDTYIADTFGTLEYICNSDDINEEIEHGDYSYYNGVLDDIGILYMDASHPIGIPDRMILVDSRFQIMLSSYGVCEIIPTNEKLRSLFYIEERMIRLNEWKDMLFNTDRPKLLYEYGRVSAYAKGKEKDP